MCEKAPCLNFHFCVCEVECSFFYFFLLLCFKERVYEPKELFGWRLIIWAHLKQVNVVSLCVWKRHLHTGFIKSGLHLEALIIVITKYGALVLQGRHLPNMLHLKSLEFLQDFQHRYCCYSHLVAKKLRHTSVGHFAHSHPAVFWQSWDLNCAVGLLLLYTATPS